MLLLKIVNQAKRRVFETYVVYNKYRQILL